MLVQLQMIDVIEFCHFQYHNIVAKFKIRYYIDQIIETLILKISNSWNLIEPSNYIEPKSLKFHIEPALPSSDTMSNAILQTIILYLCQAAHITN